MIDLQGAARQLRLTVEQLRVAADLLQQGYHPAFIERYRADETGGLNREALWTLKMEIDRKQRLETARVKAREQLPKDAELDEEAVKYLERASTEVEIEATLRAFRARRALQQSQERDGQAGQLLEMLISYDGQPVDDLEQWIAERIGVDRPAAEQALQGTSRLIANLLQCDTPLIEKLRRAIQRKASVRIEMLEPAREENQSEKAKGEGKQAASIAKAKTPTEKPDNGVNATLSIDASTEQATTEQVTTEAAAADDSAAMNEAVAQQPPVSDTTSLDADTNSQSADSDTGHSDTGHSESHGTATEAADESAATDSGISNDDSHQPDAEHAEHNEHSELDEHGEHDDEDDASDEEAHGSGSKSSKSRKGNKLTPRQRRRRWLMAMLQPMRSIKRPLTQLTSFQHLMLGRGRRSQLVKLHLDYDTRALCYMARDAFVSDKHPLATWFDEAVMTALESSIRSRFEADAIADLEEISQERLLDGAAEQLRQHLMQRPVRGHTIMLVDTVGPKQSSVVVISPRGEILAVEELPCSAQPEIVNQNVVKLGELAHKHRVTLVALTNGPARRFLVLTVRELMKQSANSGLRWTMADRSGAEAYAAGKVGMRELSEHNRRDRAAIWIARSLQNPLAEMLKVDINRMRLGSYQRELPQEPLRKLLHDVIADCVCSRGIDTHHASVNELLFVPGVQEAQARQIAELSAAGKLESRQHLKENISDWPELQARQAMGWLRVFDSSQALDATAIHPDDYHLAQRLIDNTEFSAPPAAPEGWQKRLVPASPPAASQVQTDVPPESGSETPATNAEAADVATGTDTPAAEAASASPEAVASGDSAPAPSEPVDQQAENAGNAENSGDSDATIATSTEYSSTETSLAPATEDAPATEAAAVSPDELNPEEISFKPPAAPETPSVKPEYPEDVEAGQAKAKPPLDVEKLARGWQVGREKLKWIANCLVDPFADPRLDETPIPMRTDMPTLAALEPGMCVWAVVVGVADFGAFVELSPDCNGLIHISRLSTGYVEDTHQCVQVGDLLLTWVVNKDEKKNRVALTALSPAQRSAAEEANQQRRQRENEQRGGERGQGQRRDRGHAGGGGGGKPGGQAGQQRGEGRPAGRSAGGSRDAATAGQGRGTGGGGRGQGGHGGQRGQGGRGRGPGGGRGRSDDYDRPAKTVVVTSKKPVAPISDAMKVGEEPLRSFSDLLQFYEAKRTEPTSGESEATPTAAAQPQVEQTQVEPAQVEASAPPPEASTPAPETSTAPEQVEEQQQQQ